LTLRVRRLLSLGITELQLSENMNVVLLLFVASIFYSMERIPRPFFKRVCLHEMEGARPLMLLLMDTFVQKAVMS
jgi:cell division protein FtsW (lipid II flippase)